MPDYSFEGWLLQEDPLVLTLNGTPVSGIGEKHCKLLKQLIEAHPRVVAYAKLEDIWSRQGDANAALRRAQSDLKKAFQSDNRKNVILTARASGLTLSEKWVVVSSDASPVRQGVLTPLHAGALAAPVLDTPGGLGTPIDHLFRIGQCEPNSIILLGGPLGGPHASFRPGELRIEYSHTAVALPHLLFAPREAAEARKRQENPNYFSGPTVRLHGITRDTEPTTEAQTPILHFRPSQWRDFVGSNEILDQPLIGPTGERVTPRLLYADKERLVASSLDLGWVQLSNMLTAASVLVTKDGHTLIGERSSSVSNDAGLLTASIGESMQRWLDEPLDLLAPYARSNADDLWNRQGTEEDAKPIRRPDYAPVLAPDPFHTIRRGIWEEIARPLHEIVRCSDVTILGLGWDLKFFNPFVAAIVRADVSLAEVRQMVQLTSVGDRWETNLHPVQFTPTALKQWIASRRRAGQKWAGSGLTALLLSLVHTHGLKEVSKMFEEPIAITG